MMDATKYFTPEELEKILKKTKPNKLIECSARALSNDEVYDQALIEGGVGVEPTMKLIMDQARGLPTTPLQVYHGVSSSGMQVL